MQLFGCVYCNIYIQLTQFPPSTSNPTPVQPPLRLYMISIPLPFSIEKTEQKERHYQHRTPKKTNLFCNYT